MKKVRPDQLRGETIRVKTACGNMYLTINFDDEHAPVEILARLGKSGACAAAFTDSLARVVSLALRAGVEWKELAGTLKGHTCHNSEGCESLSCADAIGLGIERTMQK